MSNSIFFLVWSNDMEQETHKNQFSEIKFMKWNLRWNETDVQGDELQI